jgi:hypothetical protein
VLFNFQSAIGLFREDILLKIVQKSFAIQQYRSTTTVLTPKDCLSPGNHREVSQKPLLGIGMQNLASASVDFLTFHTLTRVWLLIRMKHIEKMG